MNISDIDSNFKQNCLENCPYDIEWYDVISDKFSMHGVFYSKKDGLFLRLPKDIANSVSENVGYLSEHTAGGRLRIRTDSPVIAYQVSLKYVGLMPHMPLTGQMGFGFFTDDKFEGSFTPVYSQIENRKDNIIYTCNFHKTIYPKKKGAFYDYDLYFPLYNPVVALTIGFPKGSKFEKPREYKHKTPVLYYGSSITQGGCAGHPGNEYQGQLSRKLDTDYINLGFSGSAKGEPAICDYITSLPHSVFVMDYDHNAPNPEHLKKTHYAFYKRYRQTCKDTPIIFATRPDCWFRKEEKQRVAIIKNTYQKALEEGDKNVYFINGKNFFGKDKFSCTIDSVHPNDLGFYKMAKTFYPILKKLLDEKEN